MKISDNKNYQDILFILFLITANIIAYWKVSQLGFNIIDDADYISNNEYIKKGLSVDVLIWALTPNIEVANWHPLTWFSHIADYLLWGLKAQGHHVTNVVIHIINSVLLYWLLRKISTNFWICSVVVILFSLHPLRIESVAWISERKDLLSAFFWLLSIIAYLNYAKKKRLKDYFLSVILFLCGLMSKPMVVTLPFVLMLLDYWPLKRCPCTCAFQKEPSCESVGSLFIEKIPFLIFTLIASWLTLYVQKAGSAVASLDQVTLVKRFANSLITYIEYLLKMLWPVKLSIFYPFPFDMDLAYPVVASIVLLLLTVICIRYRKEKPHLFTGWFWYLGTLIPVIGIVQVGSQGMADRYTYLPMIGIFIILGYEIVNMMDKYDVKCNVRLLIVGILTVLLGTIVSLQLNYWRTNEVLMKRSIEISPKQNSFAHSVLAMVYLAEKKYDESIKESKIALADGADNAEIYAGLGDAYRLTGSYETAIEYYKTAIHKNPKYLKAYNSIGNVYQELKKYDEAIKCYKKAIMLGSNNPEVVVNYAVALFKRGEKEEALNKIYSLLIDWPDNIEALIQVSIMEMKMGRMNRALEYLNRAYILEPQNTIILKNIALIFMLTGNSDLAIILYDNIIYNGPRDSEMHYEKAIVHIKRKEYEKAVYHLHEAIRLDNNAKAHYALGLHLASQKRHEEAIIHYQIAINMKHRVRDAQLNMANEYHVLGKKKQACIYVENILRNSKKDSDAIHAYRIYNCK